MLHAQRGRGMGPGPGLNPVAPHHRHATRTEPDVAATRQARFHRTHAVRSQPGAARPASRETRLDAATRAAARLKRRSRDCAPRAIRCARSRRVIAGNDSVARVAAMAVLTDSQRIHVRERAGRTSWLHGRAAVARWSRNGRAASTAGQRRDATRPAWWHGNGRRRNGQGRMGTDAPACMRAASGPAMLLRDSMRRDQLPDDVGPRFRRRFPPAHLNAQAAVHLTAPLQLQRLPRARLRTQPLRTDVQPRLLDLASSSRQETHDDEVDTRARRDRARQRRLVKSLATCASARLT